MQVLDFDEKYIDEEKNHMHDFSGHHHAAEDGGKYASLDAPLPVEIAASPHSRRSSDDSVNVDENALAEEKQYIPLEDVVVRIDRLCLVSALPSALHFSPMKMPGVIFDSPFPSNPPIPPSLSPFFPLTLNP